MPDERVIQTIRVSPELRRRLMEWRAATGETAQHVFLEGLWLYAQKDGLDLSGLEEFEDKEAVGDACSSEAVNTA